MSMARALAVLVLLLPAFAVRNPEEEVLLELDAPFSSLVDEKPRSDDHHLSGTQASSLPDAARASSKLAANMSDPALSSPQDDHLREHDAQASSLPNAARASTDLVGNMSDLVQRAESNESTMVCHSLCVPCNDGRVVYLGRSKSVFKKIVDTTMVSLSVITWPLIFVSAAYVAADKAFADKLISVCPNIQIIQFDVEQRPKEANVAELLKPGADGVESPLMLFTKDIDKMYNHQIEREEEAARIAAEAEGKGSEATGFWTKVKRATVGERAFGELPLLLRSILEEEDAFCGGSHQGVVKSRGAQKIIEEGSFGSLGNAASDTFWGWFGHAKHNTGFGQTCFQASRSVPA